MHATRDTTDVKILNRAGGRVMRGVRQLRQMTALDLVERDGCQL